MLKFKNNGYTVFLELTHGCERKLCLTRQDCTARFYKRTNMQYELATAILKKLVKDKARINTILLYGRGDSTEYLFNNISVPFEIKDLLVGNFTSPYLESYPLDIRRIARVDSLDEAKFLVESKCYVQKTYTIVKKANLHEVNLIIEKLQGIGIKEITLNHYDSRNEINPSLRDLSEYINCQEISDFLISKKIVFKWIRQSKVNSFKKGQALIIDVYGNVVPCFIINIPYFKFTTLSKSIEKLKKITHPCKVCLLNQVSKWKIVVLLL